MRFRYSQEHIDFLRRGFKAMRIPELAGAFNRKFGLKKTESAIKTALSSRNITCGRPLGNPKGTLIAFTKEQASFVKDNYTRLSIVDLTDEFNKEFGSIKTEQQIRSFTRNHNVKSGRTGRFEKENKPWNAGTKGQGLTSANSGSFKKGDRPKTWKPVGSQRICSKDGYYIVKIAEPNVWRGKHLVNWEAKHGKVPVGFIIRFKNGNQQDPDIANLELISRQEHLYLNRNGYTELPAELKPTMKVLAKVEAKLSTIKATHSTRAI